MIINRDGLLLVFLFEAKRNALAKIIDYVYLGFFIKVQKVFNT